MIPAKVQIGGAVLGHEPGPVALDSALPRVPLSQRASQGEWVNAVMATAPYLDSQGLQQALGILDRAIANVHEVKGLESIISGLRVALMAAPGDMATMQNLNSAEVMRAHVYEQQQVLLQHLHSLKVVAVRTMSSTDRAGEIWAGCRPVVGIEAAACPALPPSARDCGGWKAASIEQVFVAAEVPKPSRDRATRPARQAQTLSTSLQVLAHEDPDCLFIVRRINKLGFKACRKLKQHFSAYGSVVRVLVAHSTVRQHGDPHSNTRRRPSSLGFVHMATAGAVQDVLLKGSEQDVDGVLIRVQRFERQPDDSMVEEDEGEEEQPEANVAHPVWERALLAKIDFGRQQSCFSTVSTRTTTSNAPSFESDASAACAPGFWQD